MSKKKIIGLCIAGVLAVGSIGGSLAWFTSSDSVTNPFATASTDNPNDPNSGIKIHENFDRTKADNTLPGDNVTKQVSVTNTATYDQLVRAKITKEWKDSNGNVVTSIWTKDGQIVPANTEGATEEALNTDYIVLNFKNDADGNRLTDSSSPEQGKWIQETDANLGADGGYYYYNGVLAPNTNTGNLLESVTLSPNTPNEYKGLKFDVTIDSEAVQASNGAAKDSWKTAPTSIVDLGNQENSNK
ncbi:BsaA family SipW-dependent biofilm matrix protein [Clostridium sp. LIBA-8841]|uniref:BsaA family SipW-dependent biofilm matrix protein n=1 Tax=Clostridium sp. LIBA-8841 TaxID=2987530 RepID=UPI002AC6CC75|nr:BsaA family SipW-dependent biofilm matrix protein [Clostridium sp. LIBA-8841]MDZ5254348.1 BsaA family SipW-dependent biofilm matrix protein [Clostridium sp. LIBA-8841]